MIESTIIVLDVAKQIFQVHGVSTDGKVTIKRKLRRSEVFGFFGMSDKVIAVFSEVLRVPIDALHDGSSPDNTPRWDSLAAVNLVLAIEEEFGIKLNAREMGGMRSIAAVKDVLRAKGVSNV